MLNYRRYFYKILYYIAYTVKIHPQLVDVFWAAKLPRPIGRKKIRLPTVDVIFQYFHNVKACGVDVSVESKKGHELIDVLKKTKKKHLTLWYGLFELISIVKQVNWPFWTCRLHFWPYQCYLRPSSGHKKVILEVNSKPKAYPNAKRS